MEEEKKKVEFAVFENKKEEPIKVYFKLVDFEKQIKLVACDGNGNNFPKGYILRLDKESGKIALFHDVKVPGLSTDSKGRVLID